MSNESYPRKEIINDLLAVAKQQSILGAESADIFAATGTSELAKGAAITLRNPSAYLQDVNLEQLPKYLQESWESVLKLSETLVKVSDTENKDWDSGTSDIAKLQSLMSSGSIDTKYKGLMSDVMRLSSDLFADSTAMVPGNTDYYKGNVQGMQSWIRGHRQSPKQLS